ncbi:hypothetical protein WMF37_24845 [Sorangium sp. So ce291]|uniref:hypothetical protein n=1 Tax=Sorangium sp. So ce291 TaxID=3133294 RepID=UPI003F60B11C
MLHSRSPAEHGGTCQIEAERLLDDVVQMAVHPLLQRRDLPLQDLNRRRLLFRVAPIEVEPGLASSFLSAKLPSEAIVPSLQKT